MSVGKLASIGARAISSSARKQAQREKEFKRLKRRRRPKIKPEDSRGLERSAKRKTTGSEQRSTEDARTATADRARKSRAREATDLGTPAGAGEMKALKGQSQDTDKANMARVGRAEAGKRSKGISKEYKATEKRLEKLKTDLKQAKAFLKGAADDQQKKKFSSRISQLNEKIQIEGRKLKEMGEKNLIRRKGGGSLKPVDAEKNPGLAKLPTPVRNKMGYAQGGGKVGKVIKANMSGDDLVRSCYD